MKAEVYKINCFQDQDKKQTKQKHCWQVNF